MMLHANRPRRLLDSDSNLIPMINVVFLLLIFFMIAGQISPYQAGEVQLPNARSNKAPQPPLLTLTIRADGRLKVDDQPLTLAELAPLLSQRLQPGSAQLVAIKADRALTARQLDAVLAPLRQLGIARVTLYSEQVE